jgi:hypothetical protein
LLLSTDERIGFSNIVTSYENGVATCSFTRTLTMPSVTNYFDLNKSYYILAAYGPVKSDLPGFHTFYKSSTSMFSFKNGQTTGQYTTPTSTTKPNSFANTFKISWFNSINSTLFIMSTSLGSTKSKRQASVSPIYFAFGLSTDQKMGSDDVAVCQLNSNGSVSLYHYYNDGKSSSLLSSSDPILGFSNIITSVTNGNPTCSFTRAKKMPGVPNYFDVNNQYYIITASGSVSSSGSFNFLSNILD